MAASWRSLHRPLLWFLTCVSTVLLVLLFSDVLRLRQQEEIHKREFLNSTEIPEELIDPAAIDLTPLVNTLINSSQSGSRQLFSLLSVTSYSSLALHKLTLLVYNISSIRRVESSVFRRRFCYCVTNDTNDLTDFTAVLLDVMGNSSSSLHEIFKSASILSVSQRNNSDCIYICVMAGKMGREESEELWEIDSITPLFNQTIVEGPHTANVSSFRLPAEWHQLPTDLSHMSPSGDEMSRVLSTAHASAATPDETVPASVKVTAPGPPSSFTLTQTSSETLETLPPSATSSPTAVAPEISPSRPTSAFTEMTTQHQTFTIRPKTRTTTQRTPVETEKPGCPWRRSDPATTTATATTTVAAHKLQPCVLELCKFFSQCLCRPFSHKTNMKRYCDDSHVWYEQHTSEVCRRVKRVSLSRNLKQRCLTKMCTKL
ncbi:uncharacterized protein LOC125011060 [Mugil cephalus]|uniref:uncharacterized protein LOC125011060 n=1 Tax=Mugil cephalus TaxID=48193 RepID=UPI001FB80C33|nr:uncharacterized protein LOC125011060 [Mugil cephalus]